MNQLLGILLGTLFGFSLYYVGASTPKKIIDMLRLENLELMKIILFAIGFSSFLIFFTSLLGIFDPAHFSVKGTNLGVVIGGLIFGVGFGLIGSCPGTCVSAAGGEGIKKAVFTVFGGLVGAFLYSLTYGYWKSKGLFAIMDLGKVTLFTVSEKYTSIFNIGYSGLFWTGLLMMGIGFLLPTMLSKNK